MNLKRTDLTGQIFGRLTVLAAGGYLGRVRAWRCQCACGTILLCRTGALTLGNTKSCGCLRRDAASRIASAMNYVHGKTNSDPAYHCWQSMKQRCLNPRHNTYRLYGARGITICERWLTSFVAFLEDMGPRPSTAHSIDRINPYGNYEPGNCRWADHVTQRHNRRAAPKEIST